MSFQKKLKELENLRLQKPDKVLSMYLNTNRNGDKWKIELKNGLNRLEEYLEVSSEEEKKRLKAIRSEVEAYITSIKREVPRSIILFASKDSGIFETFEVQVPVETNFYWEDRPVVDQLKSLYKKYPDTALVLMQQNQVKILRTTFGELQNSELFQLDVETENWKKTEEPASVVISEGKPRHPDQFEERIKTNQLRWWKNLGNTIDQKAAEGKWDKIILVGDKEMTDVLHQSMTKTVHKKIQKNLLNEKEHKVLEEIL